MRNTDGEFELVLGNKQLLSMFFLVVVLFAVFFSLGYIMGKSVGPGQTLAAAQPAAPPATDTTARPSPTPPKEAAPAPTPADTQPAAPSPEPSAPTPVKEEKQQAAPAPAVVARDLHLQIAAVRVREDAEALVESLRKKGYDVLLNTQTRDGWYRVLVGPFPNERAAQEMKAKLEKDGYKSILKKP